MAGDARRPQSAQGVELAEIVFDPEIVGEEMQLVLAFHAALFHRQLVEGRKADGVGLAALCGFQAKGQRHARAFAGRFRDLGRHDIGLRHCVGVQQHRRAVAISRLAPILDGSDLHIRSRDALAFRQHPGIADQHDLRGLRRFRTGEQFRHQLRPDARRIAEGQGHNRFGHYFTGSEAR
jgi:hypothetical protein